MPVTPDRTTTSDVHRLGFESLQNPFNEAKQGHATLRSKGNLPPVQYWLDRTKTGSTVRNLGVELKDVLATAEAIET